MKLEGKSLKSDFLRFIIPSIIAQWVFTLYTMIDGIFVARGVGETALTAVNISMPFTMGLFSISILFAVGTSTVVAILLGKREKKQADEVFTQNIVFLAILSVILTAAVLIWLEPFAKFLGATENNLSYTMEYIGTLAPFTFGFILSYSFEILIKTDGYPKLATIYVTTGAVMNCILDYIFVIVLHKGVFGAAFATGISQVLVIFMYLKHFLGPKSTIKFSRFKMDFPLIIRQCRNGFSAGITEMSAGLTIFFFNWAILRYVGEEALVSYTIISYVNSIIIMSMAGIGQGFQPLVSYYYGKEQSKKYHKLFRYGMIAAAVVSVTAVAGCMVGADGIVSLFVAPEHTELRIYSVRVFRIFIISFLLAGYNVVAGGFFTSVERAGFATMISVGRGLVLLVGSLGLLTTLFGGEGIWWTPILSEGICFVMTAVMLLYYRRSIRKAPTRVVAEY